MNRELIELQIFQSATPLIAFISQNLQHTATSIVNSAIDNQVESEDQDEVIGGAISFLKQKAIDIIANL